ncbi:thioredoxin domain-containing protein [Streptomyces sp. NPDC085463]|uniref:DsbA family protein n=1 Tax=Streptomyces sp. NPDC085463 TaxID=3365724 RepID=UPI0037CD8F90
MSASARRPQNRQARERLRAERERAARRTRRVRQASLSAGVAAVVITLVTVTIVIQSGRDRDTRPIMPPAGASGADSLVIPVGRADAPTTLTVYEDPRCPGCAQLERELHTTINKLEDAGELRVDYHVLSFVDRIVPGSGSRNAANALAAAQDSGRFRAFHDALFASPPPSETEDTFGDKETLLALGKEIDGLNTAKFASAVRQGTHDTWVRKVQADFDGQTAIQATPAVILNGKDLVKDQDHPLTPQRLTDLVKAQSLR